MTGQNLSRNMRFCYLQFLWNSLHNLTKVLDLLGINLYIMKWILCQLFLTHEDKSLWNSSANICRKNWFWSLWHNVNVPEPPKCKPPKCMLENPPPPSPKCTLELHIKWMYVTCSRSDFIFCYTKCLLKLECDLIINTSACMGSNDIYCVSL